MRFLISRLICRLKNYKLVIFKLNNEKIYPLIYIKKPKKPILAFKKFYGILIDNLFFKLNKKEQQSAVWHEIYHTKSTTSIKLFFWLPLIKFFNKEKQKYNLYQLEEFSADKYALKKTDKKSVLGLLRKLKDMENKGLIKTNLKNHPTIKDRIINIQSINK